MKIYGDGVQLYADNYWGRVKENYRVFHPKSILYSDDKILGIHRELLEYKKTGLTKRSNEELWNMHYICNGNFHPETGEPIKRLFRWSNFVLVNIPLLFCNFLLTPMTFNQILFESLNQTYNFGNNIANASKRIITSLFFPI